MTDSEALRKLIESKGLKMKYVADYLGLSAYGLQLKVDNRQEFKTSEVAANKYYLHAVFHQHMRKRHYQP